MLLLCSETPIPVSGKETYRAMAFNGCRYYLTKHCECEIAVVSREMNLIKTVKTRREYTAICYDPSRSCFWAAAADAMSAIFKLDINLQEIDRVDLRCGCVQPITGLSFCCEDCSLLVSCGARLLKADPNGGGTRQLCEARKFSLILAVLCMPPYILFYALRGCDAYFVLADREGNILNEIKSKEGAAVTAMVLEPCTYELHLLSNRRGCYPYMLRARLDVCITEKLCCCNRRLCLDCEKEPPVCSPDICGEVLESIAQVEAAIAHILNAEGEKLQKAIELASKPCELLKINASVQRTILYTAQLEQQLVFKMEALQCLCDFCECPPHCKE